MTGSYMIKLIITRHGETKGNVQRILAGIHDPLTPRGKEQAKKVSRRLKDEKIDAIFSSPLIRAKETAVIIAKNHPTTKVIIVDELKEMELGSYLHKGFDEVDWEHMPKDVESKIRLQKRQNIVLKKS
jgi:broad specificity phosphatase PhoE